MANEKRLIDADLLLQWVEKLEAYNMGRTSGNKKPKGVTPEGVRHMIDTMPKVDAVEVVHGRWVDRYGNKYANRCYDCSECKGTALYKPEADELGHWRFVQALSDNCPHCGAKMDLEGG